MSDGLAIEAEEAHAVNMQALCEQLPAILAAAQISLIRQAGFKAPTSSHPSSPSDPAAASAQSAARPHYPEQPICLDIAGKLLLGKTIKRFRISKSMVKAALAGDWAGLNRAGRMRVREEISGRAKRRFSVDCKRRIIIDASGADPASAKSFAPNLRLEASRVLKKKAATAAAQFLQDNHSRVLEKLRVAFTYPLGAAEKGEPHYTCMLDIALGSFAPETEAGQALNATIQQWLKAKNPQDLKRIVIAALGSKERARALFLDAEGGAAALVTLELETLVPLDKAPGKTLRAFAAAMRSVCALADAAKAAAVSAEAAAISAEAAAASAEAAAVSAEAAAVSAKASPAAKTALTLPELPAFCGPRIRDSSALSTLTASSAMVKAQRLKDFDMSRYFAMLRAALAEIEGQPVAPFWPLLAQQRLSLPAAAKP